jgi:hypothetical protein
MRSLFDSESHLEDFFFLDVQNLKADDAERVQPLSSELAGFLVEIR